MKDEDKTKRWEMTDLVELRQRIASLEASETRLIKAEADLETELSKFHASTSWP